MQQEPEQIQLDETEQLAGLFGPRKYSLKRQTRRLNPNKMNRRAKRIQRKYGLAVVEMTRKEVNHG